MLDFLFWNKIARIIAQLAILLNVPYPVIYRTSLKSRHS